MKKFYAITAAITAAFLFTSTAKANLNCPPGTQEYGGQCWTPNPTNPPAGDTTNNNSATAQAGAVAGAAAGAVSGSSSTVGNVGGGSATVGPVTADGGTSNATLTNKNDIVTKQDQTQKQNQGQQQQANANSNLQNIGNTSINIKNAASAAQAYAPSFDPQYKADVTSGGIAWIGGGASLGKVRPLNYEEVANAEDRWVNERKPGTLIYMAGRDNAAIPVAEHYGITESSQSKRDRAIAQREASTQTRFGAPEHTGSTPMIQRQQQPQAQRQQVLRNAQGQRIECPADFQYNPNTGKCYK